MSDHGRKLNRGGRWSGSPPSKGSFVAASKGSSSWNSPSRASQWQQREALQEPPSPLPYGPLLERVSNSDVVMAAKSKDCSIKIEHCEHVASYNSLSGTDPTILVPGKPPAWTPLRTPQQIRPDSGKYFRDPNAARFPTYPTLPAVQTIFTEQPHFSTQAVHIFACGRTMGNLLAFVRSDDFPFRFYVEVIGNTVFFVRKERSPTELIEGVLGYGHTFPEAYTTWEPEVAGSASHQRVITYTFGGLHCLIRFEVDGYHKDLLTVRDSGQSTSSSSRSSFYDLKHALPVVQVSGNLAPSQKTAESHNSLKVRPAGERIPQNAIFDLKTRSCSYGRREIDMAQILPRLWVTQVPNFIVAYHNRGVFDDIRTQCVRGELDNWESDNEEVLGRFATLIRKIVDFARETDGAKLEICRAQTDILEIRKQAGHGCDTLPPLLKDRWLQNSARGTASTSVHKDNGSDVNALSTEEKPNLASHFDDGYPSDNKDYDEGLSSDEESVQDFTACSAEGCGYCGHCRY
ncbi:hypothetical protein BJ546DRAFT_240439 [Cryomyces antarcticus]|uniref:Geranylgeranyl pyrophosphate synthetase n=1 Tax=Cryomyces antarcticus TaxID=329879 RepID=A0ABR0KUI1_9PEZI|nr:hypothetical protein LTR39_000407 [Cryomyces antarcticus]KAK5020759.1 hypothetical protein LTR60_000259 [Cryomyces antarcticus]KAK5131630.1 hypothetical protein LTR16_000569 [Cryomyces antarcticus]